MKIKKEMSFITLGAIHKGRPADSGGGGSAEAGRSIVIQM